MKFDPMTGEPINDEEVQNPVVEPEQAAEPEQTVEQPVEPEQPQMSFDPMTGQLVGAEEQPKKKRKVGLIAAVSAAVLVVAIGIGAVASGMFLSDAEKVARAVENTFSEQGALLEALNVSDIIESKEYTVAMELDFQGYGIDADYKVNDTQMQLYGNINIAGIATTDMTIGLEDSKLMVQIPYISDKVFSYDYKAEKTGYLMEMAGEDIEALDAMLEMLAGTEGQEEVAEEFADAVMEEWDKLEFEEVDEETFEVDGKDRDCVGYTTEISGEFMEGVLDAYENAYGDYLKGLEETMASMDDYSTSDFDAMFEEARAMLEYMPEMDITFYIYDRQLACISLEAEGEEMQLQFLGGDRRMQNMCLVMDGYTLMEISGETDGSNETTEILVDEISVLTVDYDSESGDFEFSVGEGEVSLSGNIESGKKGLVITINEIRAEGVSVKVEAKIAVESGAEIEEIEGEEFDLGNASEQEWMEVIEEVSSVLGM